MKLTAILIGVLLFVSVFAVHTLNDKTVPCVPRVAFVWADNNSTNATQTNQTAPPALPEHEFTFDRPTFNITKVILNFPYTSNHTIEDISVVGASAYSYDFTTTGGASATFTFIADDVDIYTFTVKLEYANVSRRDLLIALWQGDLSMETYTWTETGTEFVVHFRLNQVQESHYPTEIQVAQQVVYQMQLYLQQILTKQTSQLDTVQAENLTNSLVSMGAAIAAIAAALLSGAGYKRRRMRSEG
jgi:hypothetical protein